MKLLTNLLLKIYIINFKLRNKIRNKIRKFIFSQFKWRVVDYRNNNQMIVIQKKFGIFWWTDHLRYNTWLESQDKIAKTRETAIRYAKKIYAEQKAKWYPEIIPTVSNQSDQVFEVWNSNNFVKSDDQQLVVDDGDQWYSASNVQQRKREPMWDQ